MWLLLHPFVVLNSEENKKVGSCQSQLAEKLLRVAGFEFRVPGTRNSQRETRNTSSILSGRKRTDL